MAMPLRGARASIALLHVFLDPVIQPETHENDEADGEQAEQPDVGGEEFLKHDIHGETSRLRG
jgi:hypothetical protein